MPTKQVTFTFVPFAEKHGITHLDAECLAIYCLQHLMVVVPENAAHRGVTVADFMENVFDDFPEFLSKMHTQGDEPSEDAKLVVRAMLVQLHDMLSVLLTDGQHPMVELPRAGVFDHHRIVPTPVGIRLLYAQMGEQTVASILHHAKQDMNEISETLLHINAELSAESERVAVIHAPANPSAN